MSYKFAKSYRVVKRQEWYSLKVGEIYESETLYKKITHGMILIQLLHEAGYIEPIAEPRKVEVMLYEHDAPELRECDNAIEYTFNSFGHYYMVFNNHIVSIELKESFLESEAECEID